MPLIKFEVSLTLTWSENCVLTSKAYRRAVAAQGGTPRVDGINNSTGAIFKMKDAKLYVPVVTLSAKNDNKLLEQLKTEFKGTITWNKYRSEIANQTKDNDLNFLIDPTFTNVNRLFVLLFENEDDRTSFSKYYVPSVEIKDFKQSELENPDLKQQIDFIGRLDEDNVKMFFIIERKEETTFDFSQNSVTVV